MATVSQAGRPLRQPASGSPWVTCGASVLGRLRSSVGAGVPGVAGAPGSGVGPVCAGAEGVSVGGTPGVAGGGTAGPGSPGIAEDGAPASGAALSVCTGRPCLS